MHAYVEHVPQTIQLPVICGRSGLEPRQRRLVPAADLIISRFQPRFQPRFGIQSVHGPASNLHVISMDVSRSDAQLGYRASNYAEKLLSTLH